ncbi:MAG: hypothetical protein QG594_490 [Bacteroidota bacterium]|nr:hypothetical protein [Bacteroidota bacterium]
MALDKKFLEFTNLIGVKTSIVITILSFILLASTIIGSEMDYEKFELLCFFNILVEFFFGVIVSYQVLKNKQKYLHLLPFLFLNWFTGCFSTNAFINVFENLPIWVYVVTFGFCLSNFVVYSNAKTSYQSLGLYFINGCSFVLIIYYALFLIPITPFSVIGILALGLGFYGVVPLIVVVTHTLMLRKRFAENKQNALAFGSGLGIVLVALIIFGLALNSASNKISGNGLTQSFDTNDGDLPHYITVSQKIKPSLLNEILLKKNLVYIASDDFFEFKNFDSFGNAKQYNERKTHDPIINITYLFTNNLNLSTDDQINILKSNFDKRLETEEQLWDGKDLFTKNIKEDVKIYANNRLAYTEITMDIACEEKSWQNKEAIYSFQLPEGAVATSLSLWVNGVERKGVLTTKEKAQKAYKQIVGVEARDPSLMQWREGNKVVVRVFPINYDLPRTFKCGFTTPLKAENNSLKYLSLNIKGPNTNGAQTISRIQIVGNQKIKTSKNFELENGFYIHHSSGLDEWFATLPINTNESASAFVWKNKAYQIKPILKEKTFFAPSEIVLDLNSSWSSQEIETIVKDTKNNYFVWIENEKKNINSSNFETLFSSLKPFAYSLLPLYDLKENTLVITKCGTISANFEELEGSVFLEKLKNNTQNKKIRVINISENTNPFWQTVKEQNYVSYLKTNLKNCLELIDKKQFVAFKNTENRINIEPANMAIEEVEPTKKTPNKGSNHLYRLYAFGKVLQEQVKIKNDTLAENKFVDLAKDANIVTPISSLIVLETDEDYQKNGIEKTVNTLGNASINNDGAVPEPFEWVLIILGLSTVFYFYKKKKTWVSFKK